MLTVACGSAAGSASEDASADLHLTSDLPVDAGPDVTPKAIYTPAPPVVGHPPPAAARGPYPIVLMHGMGGFNTLENLPVTVSYFNGVQADLEAHGETEVFVTVAPPYNTSEVRAQSLAPQLDAILAQTGAAKLNLIGHSQGGMDARVLTSPAGLGYADRVASVTTIATPHRGTKVADLALGLISGPTSGITNGVTTAFLSLLEQGVYSVQSNPDLLAQATELTTSYMANVFNPKYTDAPGVLYASYAGRTDLESGTGDCDDGVYANQPSALDIAQTPLEPTATYLEAEGETSDGLVPVSSAKWDTFMECVPADHLKECGMILQNGPDPVSGFDHLVFFRAVVARIRAEGL
jgi:triacylglycerol lipase